MWCVVLFYKYFTDHISDETLADLLTWQQSLCNRLKLCGRVLVAKEGINATLSGSRPSLDAYQAACEAWRTSNRVSLLRGIDWKRSRSEVAPFPDIVVPMPNLRIT